MNTYILTLPKYLSSRFSRVHISSDEICFQDSEETIRSVEINDTSYEKQS